MQRLRRTFRWVIKKGSISLSHTKSAAMAKEKGVEGKMLFTSASRCDLRNRAAVV